MAFLNTIKHFFSIGKNIAIVITIILSIIFTIRIGKIIQAPFFGIDSTLIFFKYLSILWLTAIPYTDYLNWLFEKHSKIKNRPLVLFFFGVCFVAITAQLVIGVISLFIDELRRDLLMNNLGFGLITFGTLFILAIADYIIYTNESPDQNSRRLYYKSIFLYADVCVLIILAFILLSYAYFRYFTLDSFVPPNSKASFMELEKFHVPKKVVLSLKIASIDLFFEGASLLQSLISTLLYIVITFDYNQWEHEEQPNTN